MSISLPIFIGLSPKQNAFISINFCPGDVTDRLRDLYHHKCSRIHLIYDTVNHVRSIIIYLPKCTVVSVFIRVVTLSTSEQVPAVMVIYRRRVRILLTMLISCIILRCGLLPVSGALSRRVMWIYEFALTHKSRSHGVICFAHLRVHVRKYDVNISVHLFIWPTKMRFPLIFISVYF